MKRPFATLIAAAILLAMATLAATITLRLGGGVSWLAFGNASRLPLNPGLFTTRPTPYSLLGLLNPKSESRIRLANFYNTRYITFTVTLALLVRWSDCGMALAYSIAKLVIESMKNKMPNQEWMLLIHQLPPQPTNLRVRIWRKLQKLGAVAVKNSVYALPASEKTHEDFQWLKQEIESAGGEATVFRAGAVEGATDKEIIALFRKARDEEFAQVTAELDALTGALREQKRGGHLSVGRVGHYEAELDKLHQELERIVGTDFFAAAGRTAAQAAYERCQKLLRAEQSRNEPKAQAKLATSGAVSLAQFQGRRWMTRRNLFIDRLAAIWLIRRFIDPKARFVFVAEGETVEGAVGFDLFGGEFTHRGEDCTFETMIREFGLTNDAGLRALAEIVHDLDLKDQKFNRSEAVGLGAVIRGLAELLKDDRKLAQHCGPIFDGLYELLARGRQKASRTVAGKKRVQRRASQPARRSTRK